MALWAAGAPPQWQHRDVNPSYTKKTKDDDYRTTPLVGPLGPLPPPPTPSPSTVDVTFGISMSEYTTTSKPPKPGPPPKPSNGPPWPDALPKPASSLTTKVKSYTEYPQVTGRPDTSTTGSTELPASASSTSYGSPSEKHRGPEPSGGPHGVLYAAVIVPIAVLLIIGIVIFLCMRKRRRQKREAEADRPKAEEMAMPWNPRPVSVARPYIAPPPAALPEYSPRSHDNQAPPTSVPNQPIILGPIPSGTNGAYLTGIDTSDVVSVTSASNLRPGLVDPFSDNRSLSEPPPPYRPRSVAPPSFVSTSRQSSVRVSNPVATSQTHLIDRSPFEDPREDDTVSELSVGAVGRNNDTMSAVSDLSYQSSPTMNRSSLR